MKLTDRYQEALNLAFRLHREQERKGSGVPYVAHLLSVSALALEYGADEDGAIAALLHDAGEDQGGDAIIAEIETRFGAAVAAIVRDCTDTTETPKPPWRARKERYIAHLASVGPASQLVSACDKLHNARSILADHAVVGEALWSRFTGGRDGSLWYYRALADAFTLPNPVVAELRKVVAELESLSKSG